MTTGPWIAGREDDVLPRSRRPTGPFIDLHAPPAATTRSVLTLAIPGLVPPDTVPAPDMNVGILADVAPGAVDVSALTSLLLANNLAGATAFVQLMRISGTPPALLCLDLLAPTARRLGAMWEDDSCDFTEVTVGLIHLQVMMRGLSLGIAQHDDGRDPDPASRDRRILLAPLPGQQHTFGLSMVGEFFRRAGWAVTLGPHDGLAGLVGSVALDWFSLVGLSIGCDDDLDLLAGAILAIRRASRNQSIKVMVGGAVFLEHPECARLVGADATAIDGHQAVLQAERLLALPALG